MVFQGRNAYMAIQVVVGIIHINMSILDKLVAVVAPHNCLSCSKEGSLLCRSCFPELGAVVPDRCFRCNKLSADSKTCSSCRRMSKLSYVWIRSKYAGIPKELVHRLKYERSFTASTIIAEAMVRVLPHKLENYIIIPIPTASSRRRQRGYDQSVLIARHISRLTTLPMRQHLVRLGQSRQVGSKKADRISQLKDAYMVIHGNELLGKRILLIDDVMTTGATLECAAKIMRSVGVKRVDALVFARA